MSTKSYFDALDHKALASEFPIQDFLKTYKGMSRDELRSQQEARFAKLMSAAWKVPFYQRHWGDTGVEPGDISGLDDLSKLPTYSNPT